MQDQTSTGTIAGDLWCLAFDEQTCRPRVSEEATRLGLAAALLAELVISGYATVALPPDANSATAPLLAMIEVLYVQPPEEAVSEKVFRALWEDPQQRDLVTWLKYLARPDGTAYDDVASRLELAGIVRRRPPGGAFSRMMRSNHVNIYDPQRTAHMSGMPLPYQAIRIAKMLTNAAEELGTPEGVLSNLSDLVCAALATAIGLIDNILWDSQDQRHAQAKRMLRPALAKLSSVDPALTLICARTESTVADTVLIRR